VAGTKRHFRFYDDYPIVPCSAPMMESNSIGVATLGLEGLMNRRHMTSACSPKPLLFIYYVLALSYHALDVNKRRQKVANGTNSYFIQVYIHSVYTCILFHALCIIFYLHFICIT